MKNSYWSLLMSLVPAFALGCSGSGDPVNNGNGGSSNPGSGGMTNSGQGGSNTPGNGGSSTGNGGSSTGNGGSSTGNGGSSTGSGGASTGSGGGSATSGGASTSSGGSTSANGGTDASSGGSTAGSGSGGAPAVKLCASKAKANAVFVDFETYDGKTTGDKFGFSPIMNSYAGFWGGGTPTPTLEILGGHGGNYGMVVTATQATGSWAGLGTWMNPVTCLDASAFTGVSIWVKGSTPTGKFALAVNTEDTTLPDTMNAAAGGTCTGACQAPTAVDLPVTADWTQVSVPWAMFTGGMNGSTPVTLTGDKITGFAINFGFVYAPDPADATKYVPQPGDIAFSFDDLGFTQ